LGIMHGVSYSISPHEILNDGPQGNVMIDPGGHAVLSDIGLEPLVNSFEPFSHIIPRCRWLAPEMLIPDDEDTTVHPTSAADTYSTANTIEEV
jgi:hypothetical protein